MTRSKKKQNVRGYQGFLFPKFFDGTGGQLSPTSCKASSTVCEPAVRAETTDAPIPVASLVTRRCTHLFWYCCLLLPHLACSGRCGCRLPNESVDHTRVWMACSSVQRGMAMAPPPPDQLASFYKLVDKEVIASVLNRHARNVELSAQAAVQAEALFGDDSLVVASLRTGESIALANLSKGASGADKKAFLHRSWDVLVSVIALLLRRLEVNVLLPGTIQEEELVYEAHVQAVIQRAKNMPAPPPAALLRAWASTLGYNTLLNAMFRSLDLLTHPLWPAGQVRTVKSFVLQGLDFIPRTAGIPSDLITGEANLVWIIEEKMNPTNFGPAFCEAVLQKWR